MSSVRACELPVDALLSRYRGDGGYADCYAAECAGAPSHAEFIEAFYTTPLFRVERLILAWLARRPSTDAQIRDLACERRDAFAAWRVEARAPGQLLLTDFRGRTRSWLMVAPAADGRSTCLMFGSAVVPVTDKRTGRRGMGFAFRALLGFHRLYSRLLLGAAVARLARPGGVRSPRP